MDVEAIRAEIPGLARCIYLNTGGLGPPPRPVLDVLEGAYRSWAENGPQVPGVWEGLVERAERARDKVADLMGVTADELAFTRCISEGHSIVAYGLGLQPEDEVIISDEEHPAGLMVWLQLARRQGIVVRRLQTAHDPPLILERLEHLIGPRTRLVALSHVTCETGLRLPISDITKLAHTRGVPVLFDGAQAVGQFPINLRQIDCDYYTLCGQKWLLGGLGVSVLYVRKDHLDDLQVSFSGALADESLDRDTLEFTFKPSARRYEYGNRHWPNYVALGRAIDYIAGLGLENIQTRVRSLTRRLKDGLGAVPGVRVLTPVDPDLSTGIVSFSVQGRSGTEVNSALWASHRILGRRAADNTAMRLSVAFFTTEAEIDTVLEAVKALARTPAIH